MSVDRGRTAKHFATGPRNLAIAGAFLRLGRIQPVDFRIGDGLEESGGDVNKNITVSTARFEQQY